MNYSTIHLELSKTYPYILYEPETYLGVNYQTILNFWWFVDGLNSEQAQVLGEFYDNTDHNAKHERTARLDSFDDEYSFAIWDIVTDVCIDKSISEFTGFEYLIGWITLELMVMHALLDEDLPLLFVPMLGQL